MGTPDLKDALASLPHGEGFRFIDQLTAWVPGESAEGLYRVKGSEAFLAAHFPGNPIMHGVLLVEMLAQLAGIAFQASGQADPDDRPLAGLRLSAVRQAKILAAAAPGQQLLGRCTIT